MVEVVNPQVGGLDFVAGYGVRFAFDGTAQGAQRVVLGAAQGLAAGQLVHEVDGFINFLVVATLAFELGEEVVELASALFQ